MAREERVSILAVLRDQVSRPVGKVNDAFKRMQKNLADIGTRLDKVGKGLTQFGRQLAPLSAAIGGVGIAATKFAGDFDKAITRSTAIMGDLTEAIDKDLRDAAKAAARDVPQRANQIAEAFFFLASAGLDAEQSIAALPAVLSFAIAGQFDLATATDLSTDALSALGLKSADAEENLQNLVRVTDVLVRANTLANATTQQFSEALTNRAGAQLRLFNKDVEEGVAVLSVYADQGVKGALAGQQLFQVLRDLSRGAVENAEGFKQAGVRVFDASGEFRNVADVVADLEKSLAGLDSEQKRVQLGLLGIQERSLGALIQLVGFSDAIRTYEAQLRKAGGTTEAVADKQLQNISDQFTILLGRLELVAIELGEALGPALEVLFGIFENGIGLLEDFVGAFERLDPEMRAAIGIVAAVTAILSPLLVVVGSLITAFGALATSVAASSTALSVFLSSFPLLGVILASAGIGLLAFASDTEKATEETGQFVERVDELNQKIADLQQTLSKNQAAIAKEQERLARREAELARLEENRNFLFQRDGILRRELLKSEIGAIKETIATLKAGNEEVQRSFEKTAIERIEQRFSDALAKTTRQFEAQAGIVPQLRRELDRATARLRIFETAQKDLIANGLEPTDPRLRAVIQQTENYRNEVIRLREEQAKATKESDANLSRLEKARREAELLADATKLLAEQTPGKALTSISTFAEQALQRLRDARQEIAAQAEAGLIGFAEASRRDQIALEAFAADLRAADDALAQYVATNQEFIDKNPQVAAALEKVRANLAAIKNQTDANTSGFDQFVQGISVGVAQAASELSSLEKIGAALGSTLATSLAQGVVDVFVEGRKSVREFLADFLKSIAILLVRIAVLNTVLAVTRALLGGVGGAGADVAVGVAGGNTGGLFGGDRFQRFNRGDLVPGPSVDRDVVPAMLTPGEYVHNRRAVKYYGPEVMQALNRRLVPRDLLAPFGTSAALNRLRGNFQTGGQVGGERGQQDSGGLTAAVVVANEQTAERLFAGGPNARRRMLEEEADFIRGIIGGQV